MKTCIIIPARFGSTRLPGKPLALIAGQTMLSRVVNIARAAIQSATLGHPIQLLVATDDERIGAHCDEIGVSWIMTSVQCETGTDRALEAIQKAALNPEFILNLQGDTPLMPPEFITVLLKAITHVSSDVHMLTPVNRLSFDDLDKLRENKKVTPFSGTCAILDKDDNAIWFSKNIIPAIRKEQALRAQSPISPVFKHFGLYAYSRELLEQYSTWAPSFYEQLEGLEQLRALENGYKIRCVKMPEHIRPHMAGIDSPEDIKRAEAFIEQHGEFDFNHTEVKVIS